MSSIFFFFFFFLLLGQLTSTIPHWTNLQKYPADPRLFAVAKRSEKTAYRLSKPLIGDDGRIYACSERNLYAFESNGSIAWSAGLNYTCDYGVAPVHGGRDKVYLVAENRVLRINFPRIGSVESSAQVFFGPETGQDVSGEIVGISVSTLYSSVFITIKNRGLFAYALHGEMLWSAGLVHDLSGYRRSCLKNTTDCYFTSGPVIDRCESSIHISNSEGELYSVSLRSPHIKWVQDLSSFDKIFTITAGNNGRVYVTVPARALVLALDVTTGAVLWQKSVGPLSTTECAPVVDSNGWISIGSSDGFLYSFSPTGVLKKYSRTATPNSMIQVSPLLDCSGYGVYFSLSEMDEKSRRITGNYTYISAMKPKSAEFTMLVPATGAIYWSESYAGRFSSLISDSDLQHFVVDERILLAFITASNTGNPLACRSRGQKLASSCSQAEPKDPSIYTTDSEEVILLLLLLLESLTLMVLAGLVRFCCVFWRKKKLQGNDLGKFLEKRRALLLKKRELTRTITELEKEAAAEEVMDNEALKKLSDMVQEKEVVERKLSTTYSFGRDGAISKAKAKPLLPIYNGKTKSYSFQGAKKESVTIFHSDRDTSSSEESSSEKETSDDSIIGEDNETSSSTPASSSKLFVEHETEATGSTQNISRSSWLKRRTLSSNN